MAFQSDDRQKPSAGHTHCSATSTEGIKICSFVDHSELEQSHLEPGVHVAVDFTNNQSLANQLDTVFRVFEDAYRSLTIYKQTRLRLDSDTVDKLLDQVANECKTLLEIYEHSNDEPSVKHDVSKRLAILLRMGLMRLHDYKSFLVSGCSTDVRAKKIAQNSKLAVSAVKRELIDIFRLYFPC